MIRVVAITLVVAVFFSTATAKPRAVSLDYCADQYLLKLADPDQILAVSRGAHRDYSYMREEAAKHKQIRASAEEALALKPDVILRQWGGGANAKHVFSRQGAAFLSIGDADDFSGVIENIRSVAKSLDQEERGEVLIKELNEKLRSLSERTTSTKNPGALYVTPGGVTAGDHTMIDTIITMGGARNLTTQAGKSYWPPLPAEALILDPPELIVTGFFVADDEAINHWSAARHPVLEKIFEKRPSIHLSTDLISCAAWYSIEASELIAQKIGDM